MSLSSRGVRFTRDGLLFVIGVGGIIHEMLRHGAERPTLLLIFAGMAGLTQFLRKDESAKDDDER